MIGTFCSWYHSWVILSSGNACRTSIFIVSCQTVQQYSPSNQITYLRENVTLKFTSFDKWWCGWCRPLLFSDKWEVRSWFHRTVNASHQINVPTDRSRSVAHQKIRPSWVKTLIFFVLRRLWHPFCIIWLEPFVPDTTHELYWARATPVELWFLSYHAGQYNNILHLISLLTFGKTSP